MSDNPEGRRAVCPSCHQGYRFVPVPCLRCGERLVDERFDQLERGARSLPLGATFHGGPLHDAPIYDVAMAAVRYARGEKSHLDIAVRAVGLPATSSNAADGGEHATRGDSEAIHPAGVEEPSPAPASAAEDALDAIAKLCGCERWEYPGQVVRDVQHMKDMLDSVLEMNPEIEQGMLDYGILQQALRDAGVDPEVRGVQELVADRDSWIAQALDAREVMGRRIDELEAELRGVADRLDEAKGELGAVHACDAGAQAARDGKPSDANPYTEDERRPWSRRMSWQTGWVEEMERRALVRQLHEHQVALGFGAPLPERWRWDPDEGAFLGPDATAVFRDDKDDVTTEQGIRAFRVTIVPAAVLRRLLWLAPAATQSEEHDDADPR